MSSKSSLDIKEAARELGFDACGIAKAMPVEKNIAESFKASLEQRDFADMHYMYEHVDMRLNPCLLMPGVKSVICVALNYAPKDRLSEESYQIADYALGKDYHDVVKKKLWKLAGILNDDAARCFCDTAPVLEHYWAQQAGLGWVGKNHQLIIPHAGSRFFLGEIFTTIELSPDPPASSHCGTCHHCIDACPTHALIPTNHQEGNYPPTRLVSEKCLSYQTIENRHDLATDAVRCLGNRIYGCDECQRACPWNRFSRPTTVKEFQPKEELMNMKKEDWQHLTEDEYRVLFKGSAVKRTKYSGLMRNIKAADKK